MSMILPASPINRCICVGFDAELSPGSVGHNPWKSHHCDLADKGIRPNKRALGPLWPCLSGQFVVHRDSTNCKWSSGIVSDGWKMASRIVVSKHRVFVVGKVNHHMRVPMARRSKHLIRRPHVGKTHFGSFWDFALCVSGFYSCCDLLGSLTFQSQFCPKFVIRQHSSYGRRVQTDRRPSFCVIVNEDPDLQWSERRRSGKAPHDHAHKTVVSLVHDLIAR